MSDGRLRFTRVGKRRLLEKRELRRLMSEGMAGGRGSRERATV
jgi:hypothetical protein